MKRTCKGCRALGNGIKGFYCSLGYKTAIKYYKGREIGLIPLETCPKPVTYSDYFYALNCYYNSKPVDV